MEGRGKGRKVFGERVVGEEGVEVVIDGWIEGVMEVVSGEVEVDGDEERVKVEGGVEVDVVGVC